MGAMSRPLVPLVVLALLATPRPAVAQLSQVEIVEQPVLFRCPANLPCFRLTVQGLDAAQGPAPLPLDPAQYRVTLRDEAGREVKPFHVAASDAGSVSEETLTVVLVDLSGSMLARMTAARGSPTRFDVATKVLERFVADTFTPRADRFAIVGFHGRQVVRGVERAEFVGSVEAARRQVEQLPVPEIRNNTALYSAVVAALKRLDAEVRERRRVARLLVFTDGKNDVRPGDDPGLLGNDALGDVEDEVRRLGFEVVTIGFGAAGSFDERALRRIASSPSNYSAATNEDELQRVFARIKARQASRVHLWVAGAADSLEGLTGRTLRFQTEAGSVSTTPDSEKPWFAPAVGPPPALDLSDIAVNDVFIRCCESSDGVANGPVPRILVLLGFTSMLALAWFALPRLLWPLSYVPKPVLDRPRPSGRHAGAHDLASSVSVPGAGRRPPVPSRPADATRVSGPPTSGTATGRDPRSRLIRSSSEPPPAARPEPPPRGAGDATVYIPRGKKLEKDV
jgi:Ca-activated chloride channel family protein